MSLSDRRARVREQREALTQLKIERAQNAAQEIIKSDQFKMSALALPESAMCIDQLIAQVTKTITNPKADYLDTLRARGFLPADIRKLTSCLYMTYCSNQATKPINEMLFEEMVVPVAEYVAVHQELYNTFNPEEIRST